MRTFVTFFILLFIAPSYLHTQECTDCGQRQITIYNFVISLPVPVANHDSIMNFYNALITTSKVTDYLTNNDPTKECIITQENCPAARYLTPERALSQPDILPSLAQWPDHEPRGESPDYYIIGTVDRDTYDSSLFFVHFFLLAGPHMKEVTAGYATMDPYPAGDVDATIAKAMSQKFGPARDKIKEFEVKARDGGAPYAIKPTLTLTAGKTSLDFHEQTTIHVSLRDCDDVALANRTVTLSAEGGSLDQTSVTTDDNGTADVIFTAGTNPEIAIVTPEFSYTKPCDKDGELDLTPLALQIKKPSDCWFIQIRHTMDDRIKNSSYSEAGGTQNNEVTTHNSTFIAAWIKADVMILPFVGTRHFVSRIGFVDLKQRITQTENGSGSSFWSSPIGYTQENSANHFSAQSITPTAPEQLVSIGDDECSISFDGFDASQTGSSHSVYDSYDVINGHQHSETNTPADPDRIFSFNVNDASFDTSYNSAEVTDLFGLHERKTASVTQKCTWKIYTDSTLQFERTWQDVTDDHYDTLGLVDNHYWVQDHHAVITMYCNPKTATGVAPERGKLPAKFSLGQNFPNPFNPSTTVHFDLPRESDVVLKLFNVLGEELRILADGRRPAGSYQVTVDAAGLPSGVYYYSLTAGSFSQTRKMLLLR
jgi:hypothetical protein